MGTKHISNKLKMRFFSGDVTGKEIKEVLLAAELNPDLREEIDIMASLSDDLKKIHTDLADKLSDKAQIIAIQPAYIRPMLKAAQNKDLKAASDCVVQCEYVILKNYQSNVSLDTLIKLSSDNNWLQDGGTPLYNIGRILENYKLSIVRRYDCDLDTLCQELEGGCQIIVAVNAEKLYGKEDGSLSSNHAVVVRNIDKNTITLFDPQYQREDSYVADQFLSAWKDSQFYMVSVAERGLREYKPQPIDVSEFPLEGELKELIEAIAENSHDIWARQRMDDGWSYGPKRDDDHKKHPDLIPYSDLSESEKEYDRKTAIGILELVQRLGYKIVKE